MSLAACQLALSQATGCDDKRSRTQIMYLLHIIASEPVLDTFQARTRGLAQHAISYVGTACAALHHIYQASALWCPYVLHIRCGRQLPASQRRCARCPCCPLRSVSASTAHLHSHGTHSVLTSSSLMQVYPFGEPAASQAQGPCRLFCKILSVMT